MDEIKKDGVLTESVNQVVKETPDAPDRLENFIQRVSNKFIENKLNDFPRIVEVFRMQNKIKSDNLKEIDNEAGWSPTKDFKWEYDIPQELYLFMTNMVYRSFWADNNKKVWRQFLRALMRGDDPIETLMKVKIIYGSSESAQKARII